MFKSDLKVGYLALRRDGKLRLVVETKGGMQLIGEDGCYADLGYYFNDDSLKGIEKDFDIMKVYGFPTFPKYSLTFEVSDRNLLWKRKEEVTKLKDYFKVEIDYGNFMINTSDTKIIYSVYKDVSSLVKHDKEDCFYVLISEKDHKAFSGYEKSVILRNLNEVNPRWKLVE